MSTFCWCLKSTPTLDNAVRTNSKTGAKKNSIVKDRNEMDLLNMQKQMQRETELGGGLSSIAIGMGLSFDDLAATDGMQR